MSLNREISLATSVVTSAGVSGRLNARGKESRITYLESFSKWIVEQFLKDDIY